MANGDGQTARAYHEATNHTVPGLQRTRHVLDWENQPIPYKIYVDLPPIELPHDVGDTSMPALSAIAGEGGAPAAAVLDAHALARLLLLTAGVVRKVQYAGGRTMYFRAAACTGALYHVDLYLVCAALPDLEAGVYHFSPHDFALRRLRTGDHRATIVAASGAEPAVASAPVVLVAASTFWRNAWKYQARAYRHVYWDSGTMLANLLAVSHADGIAARLALGFVDATVNALLGLDGAREAAVALVALGAGAEPPPPAPVAEPLAFATAPLSPHEVDYPAIRTVHDASTLGTSSAVVAWRDAHSPAPGQTTAESGADRVPLPRAELTTPTITSVIRGRGSTRAFARTSIDAPVLAAILRSATGAIPTDVAVPSPIEAYVIANAVDGIPSGAYVLEREALSCLARGDFRIRAGHLDLGQELAADASANVYLLADLEPFYARYGDRGYRVAQMLAAIVGGRIYLAAYALGLGATGLTFFDDDVVEFFSPHAQGKQVLFLTAIGKPRRRLT